MEKNYNVDDILSEIKSRKMRERGTMPSAQTHAPDLSAFPDDTVFVSEDQPVEPETKPINKQDFVVTLEELPPDQPLNDLPEPELRTAETEKKKKLSRKERKAQKIAQQEAELQAGPTPTIEGGGFRVFCADDIAASELPEDPDKTRILPSLDNGDIPVAAQQAEKASSNKQAAAAGLQARITRDTSEYTEKADRHDISMDIAKDKLWLFIRCTLSTILTVLLVYLAFAGKYVIPLPASLIPEGENVGNYLLTGTVLTALLALVNFRSIGGGLISLFKMRANTDTLAGLALLATLVQGVVGVVAPENVDPLALNQYYPLAAVAMLFSNFGKLLTVGRIQTNFHLLTSDKPKKAAQTVASVDMSRECVPLASGHPTVAYSVKADFFTDFLQLSYSDKYDVGIHRAVAPVCLLSAIAVTIGSYIFLHDIHASIAAFTAVLCVAATFSATFVESIPLHKLAKKLAPMGGMVSGNKAVEDFCDTAAVILDETDLFPKGKVRLVGIKTFSQGRIDASIVDAASVLCALNGALSPVFLEIINNDYSLLKQADNIVCESGLGVSAWVDSRRILIGNHLMMKKHDIPLPANAVKGLQSRSAEYSDMLFLSCSGEITAQFAVSYAVDETLAIELESLAETGKRLVIHASDANITAQRIHDLYGYPEDLIDILSSERHNQYNDMTTPRETAPAEIVYTGHASSLVTAITSCASTRRSILFATLLELVQIILGYGLIAFMAFMGTIDSLNIVQLGAYQLFWFAAVLLLQNLKRL